MASLDQFQGCLLGLALGNAVGAPLEGGVLERALWRLIGKTKAGEMRWTDDTQMSVDVVESVLAKGRIDPDDLARRFAGSYRWSRGYGPGAAKILKRIARGVDWRHANHSVYPAGSFGNGAAMRAPIVGISYVFRQNELIDAARESGVVTHAHPLGIEGAVLLACSTASAAAGADSIGILRGAAGHCTLDPFASRLSIASGWLHSVSNVGPVDVARQLGNGIAAQESCITSVYLASRFRDLSFTDMLRFAAEVGGDVDTIGAMAGAVWGAANGAHKLPAEWLDRLEQRDRLATLATALHRQVAGQNRNA